MRSHRGRSFVLNQGLLFLTVVSGDAIVSSVHQGANPVLNFFPLAEPIKTLTSSMSDWNTASISNESSGDTFPRGCLWVCPQGHGETGHRDALKLWLAPRVKEGLIRSAPWGPAQYTTPKWVSCSPSFPLFTVHMSLVHSHTLPPLPVLERNLANENRRYQWFWSFISVPVVLQNNLS